MEQVEKFKLKFNTYNKILNSFEKSFKIVTNSLPEDLIEIVNNGRIQKFEYSSEYTWKIIKLFLSTYHKIETQSPRLAFRELYLIDLINRKQYDSLIRMIECRNRLSHEYNEEFFNQIQKDLFVYLELMIEIRLLIENQIKIFETEF